MQYRFFICKPSNKCSVARVLRQFCLHSFVFVESPSAFRPFNVTRLCKLLRKASEEAVGKQPIFKFRQVEGDRTSDLLPLIAVVTEYSLGQKVCDVLSKCLDQEGLVLFDAEMGCRDAIMDIRQRERQEVITLRLAHLRYCIILITITIHSMFAERRQNRFLSVLRKCGPLFQEILWMSLWAK